MRAPATSANLGPGFDTLGLALDLWNEVHAAPADALEIESEGDPSPGAPVENLVVRAIQAALARINRPLPPLRLRCVNRVPMGRGLGSSAAAIACGVLIGNQLAEGALSEADLLSVAATLEGHPDNLAPAFFGGLRVAVADDGGTLHVEVPLARPLSAVVFVPAVRVATEAARASLPTEVPFADAAFNIGRASLLVAALSAGRYELLREATRDRLHQPYRAPLFPAGPRIIKAALQAGALGAFTSGAGPSILALIEVREIAAEVGAAMERCAASEGSEGHAIVLTISSRGAHLFG